ncbi:dihydroxyacetone kinase subunit DhaK [Ramlibacter albus]|uniref:Dihydroxyacetone kinase subunit DhaK n=1 Tax=Ramlibacter albus TaxID=2079448 RepID=A0A923MD65_9BURK|nr:dihydroxyacetone kinase subunit DhaK [Ramlibacter albus]MBC5767144.1 dihydroxyacetone kinase subunit DhaK [Ramlibacter albus]
MKKFTNLPSDLVYEAALGFAAAHSNLVALNEDPLFVRRKAPNRSKVALISGGGSGHEPLHIGFVGEGMLDAACPGAVFTSPTPNQMLAAARAVASDAGVLFIVKNYAGDVMNFQMAMDMMDIEYASILVNDDVSVDSGGHGPGRRGVAGTVVVEKIVGAAAEQGMDLAACKRLADKVNACTASMGVAFTSCTVPEAGVATFEIGPDEMEVGVGIHGEPGRRRASVRPAAEIVDELMTPILKDVAAKAGDEVLLFVNGLGGTPLLEQYLLYHEAAQRLSREGLEPVRSLVGNYTTSLEMQGASITVTVLNEELKSLWDARAVTPAFKT